MKSKRKKITEKMKSARQVAYDMKATEVAQALGSLEMISKLYDLAQINSDLSVIEGRLSFARGLVEATQSDGASLEHVGAEYRAKLAVADAMRGLCATLEAALVREKTEEPDNQVETPYT